MFSRRRFIGCAGGMLAVSGVACYPPFLQAVEQEPEVGRHEVLKQLALRKDRLLGYPINMNTPDDAFFRWRKQLSETGVNVFAFNNVGNPFKKSPIPFNSHDYERRVIIAFGKVFGFPAGDTWGFLSHSGTDSNMHGMYIGRTLLKGRTGLAPRAYLTREAHYSVEILSDLLGLEAVYVKTQADGGMDPDDLAAKIQAGNNGPALVVATIGTTFKGAIDNVDEIRKRLEPSKSYVHVDAALFGGYLPFTKHAQEIAFQKTASSQPRYDSMAVSCHKFFGFPSPAGLFLTTKSNYDAFNHFFGRIHNPEYIHQVPGTITCSRDAVKPAEFYYFATPPARAKQVTDAEQMLTNTAYLHKQLHARFPAYNAQRSNPLSNTIYFRHPGDPVVEKYSLATMKLPEASRRVGYAHIVVMPHVTRAILDEFLADLRPKPPTA